MTKCKCSSSVNEDGSMCAVVVFIVLSIVLIIIGINCMFDKPDQVVLSAVLPVVGGSWLLLFVAFIIKMGCKRKPE